MITQTMAKAATTSQMQQRLLLADSLTAYDKCLFDSTALSFVF